jgi:hypothetical protein
MRQLAFILTILTVAAAIQTQAGILDWVFGPSDDEWMMTYWEENANHYSLPKEDALKLAKACMQYDRNPRQRFVEMLEYSTRYGSLLGEAFHYYDPGTRTFTESLTTTNTVNSAAQEMHVLRLYSLILQNGDYPNANFLERIFNGNGLPLNPSSNGAVSSPTPTRKPPLKAGAALASTPPSAPGDNEVEQPRSAANRVLDDAIRAVENREYSTAASYFDELSRLATDSDLKSRALSVSNALRRLAATNSEADAQEVLARVQALGKTVEAIKAQDHR